MYNKATFVGHLTRDIETIKTEGGVSISKSTVATNEKYKTKAGEVKEDVCFMDFEIFAGLADVAQKYLKKGSNVLLVGKIVQNNWVDENGTKKSKHILRVEDMKMLDKKPDDSANAQPSES